MSTYPSNTDAPTAVLGAQTRSDQQWFTWFRESFDPSTQRELDTLGVNPNDCRAGLAGVVAPLPEYLVPGLLSSPPGRERGSVPYRTRVLAAVRRRYVRPIGWDFPCAR